MEVVTQVIVPLAIALISAVTTALISNRNQNIENVKFSESIKNQLDTFKADLYEIKQHLKEHNGDAQKISDTGVELTEIKGYIELIKNNNSNLEKQLNNIQNKLN